MKTLLTKAILLLLLAVAAVPCLAQQRGTVSFNYDENGNLAGSSVPGFFGSEVFYDENGKTAGYGTPGLFGSTVYTDRDGRQTGSSYPGLFGTTVFQDENGRTRGIGQPRFFDTEQIDFDGDD